MRSARSQTARDDEVPESAADVLREEELVERHAVELLAVPRADARVLVAPEFLYRVERPLASSTTQPLSQWELASRLSYFLWSSPPDDELLVAAKRGQLYDPIVLADQARRMLQQPKARRFATEFFGQWLGFYRFSDFAGIDNETFPEFDAEHWRLVEQSPTHLDDSSQLQYSFEIYERI